MEAFTAINGGSDTTAAAMTNFIFFMISHPSVFRRLRAELDAAAGSHAFYDQALDPDQIANLKYLQAVLNETLRLLPAVPNGIQRTAPSDQMVAGQ
jgi:cytochrome P450